MGVRLASSARQNCVLPSTRTDKMEKQNCGWSITVTCTLCNSHPHKSMVAPATNFPERSLDLREHVRP
eukprot:4763990-Amphidinium_carterae.1